MRLRRETGDFSIVIDGTADSANCRIRKGLAAEDLIGAVIQNGILMGVVTGTQKNTETSNDRHTGLVTGKPNNTETGAIALMCAGAAASANDTFVYDPLTGIVTYTKSHT